MGNRNQYPAGVSVAICCHNSSARLPETIRHLAAQRVRRDTPWEVLIIDNASTDDTAEVARRNWPDNHATPFRVIPEPRLGLSNARERAFLDAKYELIAFVDDDNWLAEDWVQTVADLMAEHPEAGACGGFTEAVCEVPPPTWFEANNLLYAISPKEWQGGDVTDTLGQLWGAGLTIRRSAWRELVSNDFQWRLIGRKGASLTAGEDAELCMALRLANWRLWYEPRLRLKHFIPAGRLKWRYLRRVHRGSGAASAGLDAYVFALDRPGPQSLWYKQNWFWQVAHSLRHLALRPRKLLLTVLGDREGDPAALEIEVTLGRFLALLHDFKGYGEAIRSLKETKRKWQRLEAAAPVSSDAILR